MHPPIPPPLPASIQIREANRNTTAVHHARSSPIAAQTEQQDREADGAVAAAESWEESRAFFADGTA